MLQAGKAKLEGDLAVVQGKLDTREAQFQETVRQLNISKYMLSESDEARDEVGTGMIASINSMHVLGLINQLCLCRFKSLQNRCRS